MRKRNDMLVISFLTLIYVLYILFLEKNLNKYDKLILTSGTLSVLNLVYCTFKNKKKVDLVHLSYAIHAFILSLFVQNTNFLILFELIIVVNLLYWYVDRKCPIGSYSNKNISLITNNFNFLPFVTLTILTYKLYFRINQNY